jgi:hypothetical protein
MLRALENEHYKLNVEEYVRDVSKRFRSLLAYEFRKLSPGLALEVLEYTNRKRYTA